MHLSQGNRNLLVFPQPQQRAAGNWGGSLGVVSHASSSSSSSSRLAFSRRRIPAALNHAQQQQQQQRKSSQMNQSRGSKSCLSAIPSQHHNPALGHDFNDILHTSTTTSKHQTSRKEGLSEVASSVAAAAAAAAAALACNAAASSFAPAQAAEGERKPNPVAEVSLLRRNRGDGEETVPWGPHSLKGDEEYENLIMKTNLEDADFHKWSKYLDKYGTQIYDEKTGALAAQFMETKTPQEKWHDIQSKKEARDRERTQSDHVFPGSKRGIDDGEKLRMPSTLFRIDQLETMSYTTLWIYAREGHLDKAKFTHDQRHIIVTTKDDAPGGKAVHKIRLPYDPELYDHLVGNGVDVEFRTHSLFADYLTTFIGFFTPVFAFFVLFKVASFVMFGSRWFNIQWEYIKNLLGIGGMKRQQGVGDADVRQLSPWKNKKSFKSIAGCNDVKRELRPIIEYLRNPERFRRMGMRNPGGVLFGGPPGTGKTLMAQCIAGEAGCEFFTTSGASFGTMTVGGGPQSVRAVFERARKFKPSVVFIDEFDAIARSRTEDDNSGGESEGNDDAATLNQMLTELDGFDANDGVLVLAATNRPQYLDEAVTRPGRFDRIITMPLPNNEGRKDILGVHLRQKGQTEEIIENLRLERFARALVGRTGADIMSIVNQAAALAVKQRSMEIQEMNLYEALEDYQQTQFDLYNDDVSYSKTWKVYECITEESRIGLAAYHAGKALIGCLLPGMDELGRAVLFPQGAPYGFTYFIPREAEAEGRVLSRQLMEDRITTLIAGRVAERMIVGSAFLQLGINSNDLHDANQLARRMVYSYGWGRKLGPVTMMTGTPEAFLATDRGEFLENMPAEMAQQAYESIKEILVAAEAKATWGLLVNWNVLQAVMVELLSVRGLSQDQMDRIFTQHNAVMFPGNMLEDYSFNPVTGKLVLPKNIDEAHGKPRFGVVPADASGKPHPNLVPKPVVDIQEDIHRWKSGQQLDEVWPSLVDTAYGGAGTRIPPFEYEEWRDKLTKYHRARPFDDNFIHDYLYTVPIEPDTLQETPNAREKFDERASKATPFPEPQPVTSASDVLVERRKRREAAKASSGGEGSAESAESESSSSGGVGVAEKKSDKS
ncbi:ATP-dependent zinc [Pycnococcus provasolii]